jgi:hypothetical protein
VAVCGWLFPSAAAGLVWEEARKERLPLLNLAATRPPKKNQILTIESLRAEHDDTVCEVYFHSLARMRANTESFLSIGILLTQEIQGKLSVQWHVSLAQASLLASICSWL